MEIIVHGGAGGEPDEPAERQAVLDEAATVAVNETTPLDAVEEAVRVLETNERFNAGVGSAVQSDGKVRTDAGLMNSDRKVGAVCATPGIEHTISAARVVLEETPHVLIAGAQAAALAADYGVQGDKDLLTDRTREQWTELDPPTGVGPRGQLAWLREQFGRSDPAGRDRNDTADDTELSDRNGPVQDELNGTGSVGDRDHRDHDTVGAVARASGSFAAATSTGGRWIALAGRVGDVPQIGCGFYCGPAGGASATGAGEDIARVTLSRRAVKALESGEDAETAAERAIETFGELTGSSAGIIVLDSDGAGVAFNSERMQTAIALED